MKNEQIVAAIDIGTSFITAALANITPEGDIIPVAFAEIPSQGIKKGGVVNIPLVQHAIDEVIDILQADGSYHVHSMITSLSGVSIMGYNSSGSVMIRGTAITEHNIKQAVAVARGNIEALEGRQLLHILRQSFRVDKQTDIDNPVGLMGEQLLIRVHVISAAKTAYYNLLQAFSHRDVDIDQVVASGFSSAVAVSTPDEKQLGVCVLDIGAGTTDIVVIHQGVVKHTEVVPMGGDQITGDVAFFMRTTVTTAEETKRLISLNHVYGESETLKVQGVSEVARSFSKNDLVNVIGERYNQIIEVVLQKLERAGVEESFPGGFVICGGGAEQQGLAELLMKKTQLPVRKAEIEIPLGDEVRKGSRFATIMGLFMCAYEEDYTRTMTDEVKIGIIPKMNGIFSSILARLRQQF